jgi:hypothetical protein
MLSFGVSEDRAHRGLSLDTLVCCLQGGHCPPAVVGFTGINVFTRLAVVHHDFVFRLCWRVTFFCLSKRNVTKEKTPQSRSRPKRRPVPSSGVIDGAAEKLAPEIQSLKQFQRKTPRRSRPPRLRQWGLLRASREYYIVASQLL